MRVCCSAGEKVHDDLLSKIEEIEAGEIYWWRNNFGDWSNLVGDGRYDHLSTAERERTHWWQVYLPKIAIS